MREFLQILIEKKMEIFHSVLRRLVNIKFCSGQMTRINTENIQRMLRSEKKKSESSLTLSLPRVTLIDFTLSNARRFYSSMGNPTGVKGLSPQA